MNMDTVYDTLSIILWASTGIFVLGFLFFIMYRSLGSIIAVVKWIIIVLIGIALFTYVQNVYGVICAMLLTYFMLSDKY